MSRQYRTLEEAYLSIKKISATQPEGSKIVSTSPVRELAPGLKIKTVEDEHEDHHEDNGCEMCGNSDCECSHHEGDTTGHAVAMGVMDHPEHGMEGDSRFSTNDEDEEDDITVDNLHSIKESLMKISYAVMTGVHLEPWQQFKLAVVMDNLASVARSLPRQSSGG